MGAAQIASSHRPCHVFARQSRQPAGPPLDRVGPRRLVCPLWARLSVLPAGNFRILYETSPQRERESERETEREERARETRVSPMRARPAAASAKSDGVSRPGNDRSTLDDGEAGRKAAVDVTTLIKRKYAQSDTRSFILMLVAGFLVPLCIGVFWTLGATGHLKDAVRYVRKQAGLIPPPPDPTEQDLERLWAALEDTHLAASFRFASERQVKEADLTLWQRARQTRAKTACKIGLDVGHAAVAMAMATGETSLVLLDVGSMHAADAEDASEATIDDHRLPLHVLQIEQKFLRTHFGPTNGDRFVISRGRTTNEAVAQHDRQRAAHLFPWQRAAPLSCDIVQISGRRTSREISMDLATMHGLHKPPRGQAATARKHSVMVQFDDSCEDDGCSPAEIAWAKALQLGLIVAEQPGGCSAEVHTRHEIHVHKDARGARTHSKTVDGTRRRGWCIGWFSYEDR